MNTLTSLTLLLTTLSVVVEESSAGTGQLKSSGQMESGRRRGGLIQPVRLAQRGRKKSIWSYNPGHRSLAFLVAGEVVTASPPPVEPGTGEYRCLGCCEDKKRFLDRASTAPKISNQVNRILLPSERFRDLGTEPNSINDRCLGCCEESVSPSPRVTTATQMRTTQQQTQRRITTGSEKRVTAGIQRAAQERAQERAQETRCTPPKCSPDWRYESSSSSEEMPVIRRPRPRSRLQPIQLKTGSRCRHLGCRSSLGLGAVQDSSSSSEED